jgi:Adenovirus IVa2 protein
MELVPFPFRHPFTGVCSGPTGSGKSQLIKEIVLNIDSMMDPPPSKILWYYAEYQPILVSALRHRVDFREGAPDLEEFSVGNKPTLVIIDDLMSEAGSDITKLFTKGSHHRNLSIWFLMQNFFHQGKEIRTITLNAHYIILFKNPRDRQQIKVLARQMYGNESGVMEEAFELATEEPHGYLLVDLKQEIPDHLRLRSKILPSDDQMEIFTSKKSFREREIEVEHVV